MNESITSSTNSLNEKEKRSTLQSAWNSVCSLTRTLVEPVQEKEVIFYKPPPSSAASSVVDDRSNPSSPFRRSHFHKLSKSGIQEIVYSSQQSLVSNEGDNVHSCTPSSQFVSYSPKFTNDVPGYADIAFDEVCEPAVRLTGLTSPASLLKNIKHATYSGKRNTNKVDLSHSFTQTDSVMMLEVGIETDRLIQLDKAIDATVDSMAKSTQTDPKKKKWYRVFTRR